MTPAHHELLEKNIIEILDLGSLPEDQQVALVEKILTLAQQRITLRILESLSDEQKDHFFVAIEENDMDKVEDIIAAAPLDMPSVIVEEIFAIKQGLLDRVEEITQE